MNWNNLTVDETLKELNTGLDGLSNEEAQKRILSYGNNELVEEKKDGPLKLFLAQFLNILIILLIVAAVAAYFVGDIIDAIVILLVVVVNSIVGFIQEYRAEKAMEKLKGMISNEALVIRDGQKQKIPAQDLTPGDLVVLEEGDNIPADIRIIESLDLKIDESALTGESLPVSKVKELSKTTEILGSEEKTDHKLTDNIAFMETDVISGRGKGVVVDVGMSTAIGKIAEMIQEEDAKTPLQEKISALGKTLGLVAVVVCSLVFLLQLFKGVPLVETFMTAVSLAVAAVPEGLPTILTLTLALGMQRMAKSNAVVRKLLAVETLGSCTIICTDKTGTLTKNKMTVVESRLTAPERGFEIAALCNNAHISNGKVMGDPTDGALLIFAGENGYSLEKLENSYPRLMEIPLDSTRKRMTTVNEINGEKYVLSKGAPEVILNHSGWIERDGKIQKITPEDRDEILNDLNEMTTKALRVLALAYKKIGNKDEISDKEGLEQDLVLVGLVGMMDPPRREAAEAVETCKKAGITVVMITGDHKDTAAAVAKEIGILKDEKVLTGSELEELDDKQFDDMVGEVRVYARVFPEQKVRIVKALQKLGNIVSMTGDGVNDAPALKRAAIGVSMGTGTDVAKESSDMVLQDDNFATIVKAIKEGRTIFDNIRRFVKFQLSTNVGAILVIVSASLLSLPVPFNPIQILWINIIMDGPPAQSLGVEPPEKGIMNRKPEKEDILPRGNLLRIIFAGVVMALGTLVLYYFELASGVSVLKATTIAFSVFVMFQIFNVFNCKAKGGFSNKFLLLAVFASFFLQLAVVYLPLLQGIFRTTALSIVDWVLIFVVASTILLSEKLVEKFFN
jgi:P-type Ca2+ transporter type 2C